MWRNTAREWLSPARRLLGRSRAFTVLAVTIVGLGIGATTAVFSLLHGALFGPLPFVEPDRLVHVWETDARRGIDRNVVNPGNFVRWREGATSFERMAAYVRWQATVQGSGEPARLSIGYVTGEFFETLGVQATFGRLFRADDGREGNDAVVVLSDALWRTSFGADPGVVGSTIRVQGEPRVVLGVAPASIDLPAGVGLWEPIVVGDRHRAARGRSWTVLARLRPAVSLATAQEEMDALAARGIEERPEVNTGWGVGVHSLREDLVGDTRGSLTALMVAVVVLLAIGCANLAGLLLARDRARWRENAVRSALGASVGDHARQALAEALTLALAGAAAGLVLAHGLLRGLVALVPSSLPSFVETSVDARAVLLCLALALLIGTGVGLAVARGSARREPASSLLGARVVGPAGRGHGHGWGSWLVIGETALALVLLCAAALLVRSWVRLNAVDVGLSTEGVLVTQIDLPSARYADPVSSAGFFAEVESRAAVLPGVQGAGAISWMPLAGPGAATAIARADLELPPPGQAAVADVRSVTPGWLSTAGMKLRGGRWIGAIDDSRAPHRAVVNEALVRELFPASELASVIGSRVRVAWGDPWPEFEIVGVVEDARLVTIDQANVRPAVYWAQAQLPSTFMTLAVRTDVSPGALEASLRRLVREIDPAVAIAGVRSLDEIVAMTVRRPRFTVTVLLLFAVSAVVLAALGVYGVSSLAVARRRREIGVRLALGGRSGQVFAGVVWGGLRLSLIGAGVGMALAAALTGLVRGLLFGVAPSDPLSLALAVATLLVAGALAAAVPAWRASRIDPAMALRQDG